MNSIYLDHHATTPVPAIVLDAMAPFWSRDFGNPHSAHHSYGWRAALAVEDSSSRVSALFGFLGHEVVYTSGATEANNLAIIGTALGAPKSRRRIIVSAIEHKCVLASAFRARELFGFSVELLRVDRFGIVAPSDLAALLDDDVALVSVCAVNNEVGCVQDLSALSQLSQSAGALFHTDAAQCPAGGFFAIPSSVDLVTLSAHKAYGPKGIGALLVRSAARHRLEPVVVGGGQQDGLRSGTLPVALCVGMAAAIEYCRSSIDFATIRTVRNELYDTLKSLAPDTELIGPALSSRHPGNLCVRLPGVDAEDLLSAVQASVSASTGSACTGTSQSASHVLLALGLSETQARECLRLGVGSSTSISEVRAAAAALVSNPSTE